MYVANTAYCGSRASDGLRWRTRLGLIVVLLAPLLSSCASFPGALAEEERAEADATAERQLERVEKPSDESDEPPRKPGAAEPQPERDTKLFPGSDRFVASVAEKPEKARQKADGQKVRLNFDNAVITEVVKTILGDILNTNYVLEPGLKGKVTLHTATPIPVDGLLPILESLLKVHGGILVKGPDGVYSVGPKASLRGAAPGPSLKETPPGYSIRIVRLEYIAAQQMQRILKPIAPKDAFLRVDQARNLLMLAGTGPELEQMLRTIEIFDVDAMAGMSVGLFPLESTEPGMVADKLESLFGEDSRSPLAGMFQVVPMEHLNSVMVVSPRRHYLSEVGKWVERLDQSKAEVGRQLFVYPVQNGEAKHVADLLSTLFGGKTKTDAPAAAPSGGVAPGLEEARLESPGGASQEEAGAGAEEGVAASGGSSGGGNQGSAVAATAAGEVRVVADEVHNLLLIMASRRDYEKIRSALQRIDIRPLQVLVEASIMEVSLTGELRYGLQWFFQHQAGDNSGRGTLDLNDQTGLESRFPGFSYTLTDDAGIVQAVLNTLAKDSRLRVISSPSLLVVDNQTAQIRVGDQQPVSTGTTVTEGGVTTERIEFKDTGVQLEVTPRVNAGGLVTMEISQDVTDVGQIDQATGQRSFLQRNIKSTVAVQSGDTVVLGGLIEDNDSKSKSGLPGLYRLPVIGNLFGNTSVSATRTELIVLLTPQVIRDREEMDEAGEQLKDKLKGLREEFERRMHMGPQVQASAAATDGS